MKKILFVLLLFTGAALAQRIEPGQVKGLFFGVNVGPRVPISSFADYQNPGIGFDLNLSYTDNKILPIFIYGKIGYQHYPGSLELYKSSDYSSYASNLILLQGGARYFLTPLVNDMIILMPVIEAGVSMAVIETAHQFKIDSGRGNFTEELTKFGFHVGAGISAFLLDVMGYYTYFQNAQYLSFDLRLRIPIFATYQ